MVFTNRLTVIMTKRDQCAVHGCLDETLGGRKTRGASNIVRIMQRTTSGGKCGVVKDLFVIIRASKIPRWVMSSPLCCPALSASSWQDPSS